jgi:hypothetical protein
VCSIGNRPIIGGKKTLLQWFVHFLIHGQRCQ